MSKNKLQNIKAVKELLEGTHKFQTKKTTGFSDAKTESEKSIIRAVGDVWEETDPVSNITYVFEQKDGYRIKKTKNSDIYQNIRNDQRIFKNCRKEQCTCTSPKPVDEKMKRIHEMCLDCVIDMEHELKKSGKFEEYEQQKIKANAIAWLRSAEQDVQLMKLAYTQAMEFVSSSDGVVETWGAKMTKEEFEEKIEIEFNKFKEKFLNNLNKTNGENND